MFDIIRKDEYFDWTDPKVGQSRSYSLVPSHYSLKGIQDAWILSLLQHKRDLKMAEVGGGKSRVLEMLSQHNECWNIDKFEGLGAGPLEIPELPGVKIVRAYLGDFDAEIPDNYFDIVFSISVIEHVPKEQLDACFADCCRILKPGGLLLHAIDLYISDAPSALTETIDLYRVAIETQDFEWLTPPAIDNFTTFRCDYASNSDLTMSQWNHIAPSLKNVRKTHQSVSIKLLAIKTGDRPLTEKLLAEEPESLPSAPTPIATPQAENAPKTVVPSSSSSHPVVTSTEQAAPPSSSKQRYNAEQQAQRIASDVQWLTTTNFVKQHLQPGERVLAPPKLRSVFPKCYAYSNAAELAANQFQWVLVHKGKLAAIDSSFLKQTAQQLQPVFANAVFVVFSSRPDITPLISEPAHLDSLMQALFPQQQTHSLIRKLKTKIAGALNRITPRLTSSNHLVSSPSASGSLVAAPAARTELIEQAKAMRWFHAIDFGDFQSAGRFKEGQRQNINLFPVFEIIKGIQVKDMECLDVGSACGLISFGLRSLGAKRVAATDIVNFKTLTLANELLNANVEYYPFTRADAVSDRFPRQRFDLVVCAGVLYHMFNPMGAIAEARLLLRNNGLFVVETAYDPRRKDPVMELNSESATPFREAYTYWNISESAVAGMLKLCGFNIIRCVRLQSPSRIAFLAQAVSSDQIEGRTDLTKRMHELGFGEQKYVARNYPEEMSGIQFDQSLSDMKIDIDTYVTSFPHHVDFPKNGVGASLYNPKQSNF